MMFFFPGLMKNDPSMYEAGTLVRCTGLIA